MRISFGTSLIALCALVAAGPAGAQLIDAVDYSDTFTLGQNGRANGVYGPQNIGAYAVEDLHGHSASTWHPQTTYSFNDIPGSYGAGPTVLAAATGNPGAAGGVAQSGGGDFSFAYGLRTSYVVEMDAFVSPGDRTDISSWANPGDGIGATNSLSVFFRRDSIGNNSLGLYNGVVETPVLDGVGNRVLIGVDDDNWHQLAVHFDQDAKALKIYVDGSLKADLDLTTFAGGIYQNYSNAAVGAGGAGAFVADKVLWFDNFRVGAPPGASSLNACFTRDPISGSSPLRVSFDAGCSSYEGAAPTFGWDFGDGGSATGAQVEHVFANGGDYQVVLTVTQGAESKTATRSVRVYDSRLTYQDDFDRPDGAVDGWTVFSGTWRLSGNSVVTGPTTGEDWIWAGSPPISIPRTAVIEWDQFFLAPGTEPSVGRHGGLAFCVSAPTHRYDAGWNGYFVDWIDRASDRGLRLSRVTNGAFAEIILGQGAAAPPDVPQRWRLELDGVHIKLSADGVQYFDVEDTTHQGGLLGLWAWAGGQQLGFDNLTVNGQALTACFTGPRTLVGDAAGDFDASCSSFFGSANGTIDSYTWDFGDGSNASGAQVSHSYAQPGSYDVVLTVQDGGGRSTSTGRKVDSLAPLVPFSDCFDRDPAPVDGWTPVLGNWNITADGVVEVITDATEAFLYAGNPPRPLGPEFVAEVDLNLVAGSHPVVGRHAAVHFYWNNATTNRFAGGSRGYVVFYIDRTSDRGLSLARFENGGLAILNPPGGTPNFTEPPATLRIEVDGPDIRVFADGEMVIEAQDSTYRDGFFALWSWNQNHAQFDNVRIPPSTGPATCDLASLSCTVNEAGTSLSIQGTLAPADECTSPGGCECPEVEIFLDGVSQGVIATPENLQGELPLPPGACTPGSNHELMVFCTREREGGGNGASKTCSFTCPQIVTGGGRLPGDCNEDQLVDISDAICLFGYLFLGAPSALPCGNGTNDDPANKTLLDHNADVLIDISDGIGLLNYLFASGPPPAAGLSCIRINGCTETCAAPSG